MLKPQRPSALAGLWQSPQITPLSSDGTRNFPTLLWEKRSLASVRLPLRDWDHTVMPASRNIPGPRTVCSPHSSGCLHQWLWVSWRHGCLTLFQLPSPYLCWGSSGHQMSLLAGQQAYFFVVKRTLVTALAHGMWVGVGTCYFMACQLDGGSEVLRELGKPSLTCEIEYL